RSWNDRGPWRRDRAPRSSAPRANPPHARRCRARSRAPRSSRAAASGSIALAAGWGVPSPARRTPDTAPRRTGRSRPHRGWRSVARRTGDPARPAGRWSTPTSGLARSCVCPSPWTAVYGATLDSGDESLTDFHHGLLSHQICDPHHCDHVTVIERLLFCALRASPDMVLFRRKGLAILHEPKLSFSDVADHGILHRVIGGLR